MRKIAILCLLLMPSVAWAFTLPSIPSTPTVTQTGGETYYVDKDIGNDANDCTAPAAPCDTIMAAINKAGFGASDTLIIGESLDAYAEIINITTSKDGSDDTHWVVIKGAGGERPTIAGTGTAQTNAILLDSGVQYVKFSNLDVTKTSTGAYSHAVQLTGDNKYIIFDDMEIYGNGDPISHVGHNGLVFGKYDQDIRDKYIENIYIDNCIIRDWMRDYGGKCIANNGRNTDTVVIRNTELEGCQETFYGTKPTDWVMENIPYSWSGTTLTVTFAAHGLSALEKIKITDATDAALVGEETVATVPNVDQFTVTVVNGSGSGTLDFEERWPPNSNWNNDDLYFDGCNIHNAYGDKPDPEEDPYGDAIDTGQFNATVVVANSKIYDSGRGIEFYGTNSWVWNTLFYEMRRPVGASLIGLRTTLDATNVYLLNNTFKLDATDAYCVHQGDVSTAQTPSYEYGSVTIHLYDNILMGTSAAVNVGLIYTENDDHCTFDADYNYYYHEGATGVLAETEAATYHMNDFAAWQAATTEDANSITGTGSDPGFVSIATDDYNLLLTSSAIDAGTDAGVTTDINGTRRPIGLGYDIGAYEYGLPIFPGAEGFGTETVGGRTTNAKLCKVNIAADTGGENCCGDACTPDEPDSDLCRGDFEYCLETLAGPKIVVFTVGGKIDLTGDISVKYPNISVFGQTAPGGGICVSQANPTDKNYTVVQASDVLIQGLRFRPDDSAPGTGCPVADDGINAISVAYQATGTHDLSDNDPKVMTNSDIPSHMITNRFVGSRIYNATDGNSSCLVTSNGDHTITCTDSLSGGTDNHWDLNDVYYISAEIKRVVIDHCSLSWACNEQINFPWYWGNEDMTFSWNIVSECFARLASPNSSKAINTAGLNGGSFHHNLIAHCATRTPKIGGASAGDYTDHMTNVEVVNNVIYNGYWSPMQSESEVEFALGSLRNGYRDIIGNYFKKGANSAGGYIEIRVPNGDGTGDSCLPANDEVDDSLNIYLDGNYSNRVGWDTTQAGLVRCDDAGAASGETSRQVTSGDRISTIHTAAEAFTLVLNDAGAHSTLNPRDSHDESIVTQTINGTGGYVYDAHDWPTYAEGVAPTDTDLDGLPDAWEDNDNCDCTVSNDYDGCTATQPDSLQDCDSNGYWSIEDYANSILTLELPPEPPEPGSISVIIVGAGTGNATTSGTGTGKLTISSP